jgi:hypothetical protein
VGRVDMLLNSIPIAVHVLLIYIYMLTGILDTDYTLGEVFCTGCKYSLYFK